jgi:hypothetical protein
LTDPAGNETLLEARAGVAIVPHPDQPGFYLIAYAGPRPGSALAVVNLTSEVESDLRAASAAQAAITTSAASPSNSPVLEPPGDWGFVAAAIALVAIVLQVLWLTRSPARVDAERVRPLRPDRRGLA